jgi:hypothetical protein
MDWARVIRIEKHGLNIQLRIPTNGWTRNNAEAAETARRPEGVSSC